MRKYDVVRQLLTLRRDGDELLVSAQSQLVGRDDRERIVWPHSEDKVSVEKDRGGARGGQVVRDDWDGSMNAVFSAVPSRIGVLNRGQWADSSVEG